MEGGSVSSLFRSAAVQAVQPAWAGEIRLANRPMDRRLAWLAVMAVGGAVGATALAPMDRKVTVSGHLEPAAGLVLVAAASPGVLKDILVPPGSRVAEGQILARLQARRPGDQGDLIERQRQALATQRRLVNEELVLVQQRAARLGDESRDRQRHLDRELQRLSAERDLQSARQDVVGAQLQRQQDLAQQGFLSPSQVASARQALLEEQQRGQGLERGLLALQREAVGLKAQLETLRSDQRARELQLQRTLQDIAHQDAELETRAAPVITAPSPGRVMAWRVNPGAAVAAQDALLEFEPGLGDGSQGRREEHEPAGDGGAAKHRPHGLQAVLWVPSRAMGFLRPGQAVHLRLTAFAHRRHGALRGDVRAVAPAPVAISATEATVHLGAPTAHRYAIPGHDSLYRVEVRLPTVPQSLQGHVLDLRPGLRLEADIVLEPRAVWHWLLEPLMGVARRRS